MTAPTIHTLPPAVAAGGYVYALAFSNDTVKVGMSQKPAIRFAAHTSDAYRFGMTITDSWISAAHPNYQESERALIAAAATLAGHPDPLTTRDEIFGNVNFSHLIDVCTRLAFHESPADSETPIAVSSRKIRRTRSDVPGTPRPARLIDDSLPGAAFARLLVAARIKKGLTQDDLVAAYPIPKSTLVRWENGRSGRLEPVPVKSLCRFLGIDPVDAALALGLIDPEDVGRASRPPRLSPRSAPVKHYLTWVMFRQSSRAGVMRQIRPKRWAGGGCWSAFRR